MPFENQLNIDIKAFFFNAMTDYLPYYKNFSFTVQKETTLKEVLARIKEQNSDFSYPEKDLIFRVNELMVTGEENLADVIEILGTELTIDPALKYRSDNGLVLNNHDFMHQFRSVFQRHLETKEDLEYYISLYPLHYASETLQYNREYIGDAILLTAHKMIENGSEFKDEIIQAINDEFDGIRCCEYENNIFKGEDHRSKIDELKAMLDLKEKKSFADSISALTLRKHEHELETLEGHNVALYIGNTRANNLAINIKEEVDNSAANYVQFEMSTKLAGQTIMNSHSELAHLKAGTMLLNALDSGADTLVFENDTDLTLFRDAIGKCEKVVGREIELKLISLNTFHDLIKQKVEA